LHVKCCWEIAILKDIHEEKEIKTRRAILGREVQDLNPQNTSL